MIGRVLKRLGYLRFLLKPSTVRWCVARVDFLVADHLLPWSELRRQTPSMVHPSVSLRWGRNIHIGRHTRIQSGCVLWASPESRIVIGEHTGLGPGTMVFASNHQFRLGEPYHLQPWTAKDVVIGRDVWVGAGSLIMPGVTIGDCCVVAAGSVVTHDVPPNSLVAGVPARPIRSRDAEAVAVES